MFLTFQETADYLNISKKQIERLCKSEGFPSPYSFGKKAYRFNRSEIDQWIKTRKTSNIKDIKVIPVFTKPKSKKINLLDTKELNSFLDNYQNREGLLDGTTRLI